MTTKLTRPSPRVLLHLAAAAALMMPFAAIRAAEHSLAELASSGVEDDYLVAMAEQTFVLVRWLLGAGVSIAILLELMQRRNGATRCNAS